MHPRTIANAIYYGKLKKGDTVLLYNGRECVYESRANGLRGYKWVIVKFEGENHYDYVHANDIVRAGWAHQRRRDGEDRRIR